MPIRAGLHHVTSYQYDRPVTLSPHIVRLRPAPHCRTPVLGYGLTILPAKHFINWQQDPFGNWMARLVFPEPTREFSVTVDLSAEMRVYNPFDFFVEPSAEKYPFTYEAGLARDLAAYLTSEPASPALAAYVEKLRPLATGQVTIDALVAINRQIQKDVSYLIRLEPGVQTPEETLTKASGSCRDSGWLLVNCLRHLGIAARFVSGYLIQLTADQKSLDGPSGTDKDFTDLHAWCEAYLPGAGWIGLDPTSGLLAGEGHLPLAATPWTSDAAPISGSMAYDLKDEDDELGTKFHVEMKISRLHEDPRVTKPYTDGEWAAINAAGAALDAELAKHDVRLTVGGEPTFVSLDDPDSAQWNTEALGDHKKERATVLLERLRKRWCPEAIVHLGQGKWYPGEPLPRWAYSCFWRNDGVPLWRNPAHRANPNVDAGHGTAQADKFLKALLTKLDLPTDLGVPAHEDVFWHLWKEQRLPPEIDPLKADLKDDLERQRLARLLDQGLGNVVGYALPITRWGRQWVSSRWLGKHGLKRGRLFLVPGDSPMGYRLPLDSLSENPYAPVWPADPTIKKPALPPKGQLLAPDTLPLTPPPENAQLRTTLCVEPRGGVLYVFMPPTWTGEDWCDLAAAIEDAAEDTGLPVVIEGYLPPRDPRISHFSVTPDPGVIEVNVHPAKTWGELSQRSAELYEEARQSRLTTEKFLVDGRHVGTGGGNHITLGGATPSDSPFLRRPDVLRSFISYWHNHPSLSYLFSGLFIGPTSQAPRADEARTETIYELETALSRIPDHAVAPPWLVDRTLRNLLIDLTGNTHRAEFCIDKMWSPDSTSGRLGLLEMRNFEMPPHERMSLAAHLLIRSLLVRFWKQPYHAPLAKWGHQLHDRFLLPHFVWQDFKDVLAETSTPSAKLDPAWFQVHREFRFPRAGELQFREIGLELRTALEPWHVLGEEATGGGTARYVDSSVERLELKATGLPPNRYRVRVNGIPLPLRSTGAEGESVCGVRFRAWQPPSCLHPTIPVHAPLVFDLVDTWSKTLVAGCTYHVAHPGGRNPENKPINALEAEARRIARFFPIAQSSHPLTDLEPEADVDCPFTLDLRRWS